MKTVDIYLSVILITFLLCGLLYITSRPDTIEHQDYRPLDRSSYHIHNHFNIPIVLKSFRDGSFDQSLNTGDIETISMNPLEIRPVDEFVFKRFSDKDRLLKVYDDTDTLLCKDAIHGTSRSLHIGLVSSRIINQLSLQQSIHGGVSHVYLHNMLDIEIIVNGVRVPANTRRAYSGLNDHQGVMLGTIFTAKPGYGSDGTRSINTISCNKTLFEPFKLKVPATDIYFGITSHINQPKFGGVQTSEDFQHDPRDTENHQFGERQLTDLSRADRSIDPRSTIEYD